jgi:hypothetical protein
MEAKRSTTLRVTESGINGDQKTKPTTSSSSSSSSSSPPMKRQKLKKKEEKQRKLKAKFGIGGENAHNTTTEDGKLPQCDFFLKKKNRYCALLAINNSPNCVFHQPQAQAAIVDFRSSNKNKNCNPNDPSSSSASSLPSEDDENLLVPCPVDPRHQVRRKNVESHSKKCPFLARKKAEEARPFFHEDINLGSDDEKEDEGGGGEGEGGKVSAIDRFTAEEFLEFRRKIEKAFQEIVTEKEGFPILHPSLPKPVEEPIRQLNPSFNLEPLE